MALFKIAKGTVEELSSSTKYNTSTEGYCYVAKDTDNHVYFLVDMASGDVSNCRYTLSAAYAKTYPVTIKEWGASS